MIKIPELIFLDTNVYLIGAVELESPEGLILQWAYSILKCIMSEDIL
jgi:hypothetical protein